ncbi:MAG TPA: hypothetical protein VJK04_02250 [Candidatus Paceibacterota bacterium]
MAEHYSQEELKRFKDESYPFLERQEAERRERELRESKLGQEPKSLEEFGERWAWVRAIFDGRLSKEDTDKVISAKELEVLWEYAKKHGVKVSPREQKRK